MPYTIDLTRQAQRTLDRVDRPTRDRFLAAFEVLKENPNAGPNIVLLNKHPIATYRYRVGGWRILYRIEQSHLVVVIERIDNRGDAYKNR